MARLKRSDLLAASAGADGRRGELLSLASAGTAALRGWLTHVRADMGGAPVDPLRTRVNYLFALSAPERTEFLARAVAETQAALERARAFAPDPQARNQRLLAIASRGVELQLEARLEFLHAVGEALTHDEGQTP